MTARGELTGAGWRQGSMIRGAGAVVPFLKLDDSGRWQVAEHTKGSTERLVIASQSCDIEAEASREPFVEGLQVFATADRVTIYAADGRSHRQFLLRHRQNEDALIASAPHRVLVAKESLVGMEPEFTLDAPAAASFRVWLARRASRPAMEQYMVDGFQRPVRAAVAACYGEPDLKHVLDGVESFKFHEYEPRKVELLLVREDGVEIKAIPLGKVMGIVVEAVKEAGEIEVTIDTVELDQLSARDERTYLELSLDEFSPAEIADGPAGEIPGGIAAAGTLENRLGEIEGGRDP